MPLNPNRSRDFVNGYANLSAVDKVRAYPLFLTSVKLEQFRHIKGLEFDITHPITVVSGTNRIGKTSVLMAIGCSHFNFDRQDVSNGQWRRVTWSDLVRFTIHDQQTQDWKYELKYREGNVGRNVKGYRTLATKKWGGVGTKKQQIGHPTVAHPNGGRHVCLIDLNRIIPGRHLSKSAYRKSRRGGVSAIEKAHNINEYLSYILETDYTVQKIHQVADNSIFKFDIPEFEYSSFNTASGEDALINLLIQVLHMPENSLILIDELEVGLHPKVQRRLMNVLYIISQMEHKQFIIVSHSYAVIDSVPLEARVFIHRDGNNHIAKKSLSTYEILTHMDSKSFATTSIYVEDEVSKWIVDKAVNEINEAEPGFVRLLNVIAVGSADKTYGYFKIRQELRISESLTPKPVCILDGDMRAKKDNSNKLKYPPENDLFFHDSNFAPEKMLLQYYLAAHKNDTLNYHLYNSNPHCLFAKMIEEGVAGNQKDAFEKCFQEMVDTPHGRQYINSLKEFLRRTI
ncbi:MAG: AAA family ATPase [Muribaculum sp.]|nr:AAA family ATPase [Muribaculum sp.]